MKINPLYILSLIICLFAVSFFSLKTTKNDFNDASKEFVDFQNDAKRYVDVKDNWSNMQKSKTIIENIISDTTFKNSKVLLNTTSTNIQVQIEDRYQNVLSNFLTKILNSKLLIKNLEIENRKITVEIEIK